MGLVSATTIIRSLAIFHITLAAYFIRNPKVIADQNIVFLLGESMQLPTPRDFSKPSASNAFIGVLLAFLGITDLTALSLSDEFSDNYWGTQTPVRLLFLFVLSGYSYLTKEGGVLAGSGRKGKAGAGENLKNSIVFTWGFLEMVLWFWVFVTLRDDRRQRAQRLIEKRRAEANML